ncbi:ABC transporter related protein [uncultured Paludibacter sp.]|nr:ABC transporter related protein [uncultured Paludibacter sp.]
MIEIKNLSFHYQKKSPLFDNLSLDMENGRIVGLLGKNGAGKSTLLNLMAGLIASKGGSILVNQQTPFQRNPMFLKDIYLVPEEFSFPSVTIETYVKAYSIFYPHFDHQKLDKILIEFELKYDNNLNKLSHGQRKKFLIAFALASNCSTLLLDEPTNGLDIPSKSQFRKILVGSVTEEQLVIISTHQVKDIDTVIDTVIVLDNGKVVFKENTDEILQKFHFETVPSLQNVKEVFYSEQCPSGYKIIQPAGKNESSVIDLEMFFNAVISKSF